MTQRVHPTVMWAKFAALVEGARLASRALGARRRLTHYSYSAWDFGRDQLAVGEQNTSGVATNDQKDES